MGYRLYVWKRPAWGDVRIPIEPEEGTDTFGRDRMYVHGGFIPGSAGCIDVYNPFWQEPGDDLRVARLLRLLGQPTRLRVDYDIVYPPLEEE